ncbi:MAG: calcium-binding protein [Baekduiaceae bacterium]
MLPPRLTLSVLLAVSLAAPASASASSVSNDLSAPAVTGTAAVNSISIAPTAGALRFTENAVGGGGMTAGANCVTVTASSADCDVAESGTIIVGLQGASDNLFAGSLASTPLFVNGGTGNDTVTSGGGDDFLAGAAGGDTFHGGEGDDYYADTAQLLFGTDPGDGDDTFNGDGGNDIFDAGDNHTVDGIGKGSDTFNGGSGIDTADYSGRSVPLAINVAAIGPDGAAGENDTITNAEKVLGGSAADTITGGPNASTLAGGAGGDTLRGGAAADVLFGGTENDATGSGDDTLDGGGGADVLRGGDGVDAVSYATRGVPVAVSLDDVANDGQAGEGDNVRGDVEAIIGGAAGDTLTGSTGGNVIDGGGGGDTITGGDATDVIQGGEGDDGIQARDGAADAIACGTGTDSVVADTIDVVEADCEVVDRPAVAVAAPQVIIVPPAASSGGTVAALPATVQGGTVKPDKRGRIKVTVRCPVQLAACAGTLALRTTKPAKTLSTKAFKVPAGSARSVTFTLSKGLRAKVRRGARLRLRLVATVTGVTTNAAVTVRR